MRRGGTSLTPNTLAAPLTPSRRSSAVELSSYTTQNASGSSGSTLGNNLGSTSVSRSAATSPVGGTSTSISFSASSSGAGGGKDQQSPRHKKLSTEAWVCPNDRQLALRAKLDAGWSVKTASMNHFKQPEPISAEEHEQIRQVVEKAEALEMAEEQRLGRLVDRLERLRHSRLGNGETDCILCGEVFRFYHHSQKRCMECGKMTCGKCGRECHNNQGGQSGRNERSSLASSSSMSSSMTSLISSALFGGHGGASSDHHDASSTIWLCKICAEQREMWKKSGAWFFKGMPKYAKPHSTSTKRRFSHFTPVVSTSIEALTKTDSVKDENSSEDECLLGRRSSRRSVRSVSSVMTEPMLGHNTSRFLVRTESEATEDDFEDDDTVSIPSANGQSPSDVDTMIRESRRLSRPRGLPEVMAPPAQRSTSTPPSSKMFSISSAGSSMESPTMSQPACRSNSSGPGVPSGHHLPPHGVRSMSPRMFRPPPGMRGPPPPWAARGFRPPFDPRFSPRGLPRRHMGPRPPPRHRPPGPPRGPPGMMRHHRPPYGGPRYPPPPGTAGPPSFPYSAPQSPMGSYRPPMAGNPLGFTPITDSPSPPASLPTSVFSEREAEENEVVSTPEFPTLAANTAGGSKQNEDSSLRGREDPEELEYEEEVPSPPPRAKAKPWPEKENKFASTLRRLSTVRKKNKNKKKFRDNKDFASNGGDSGIENATVTTPSSIHEAGRPSSTTSRESDAEALTSGYFSRQESQSRGSDETLSPPRSPEGSHGLIEFNLAYDESSEDVLVNVIKAKKLKGMDVNGLSDSYCRISIVPPLGRNIQSWRKTKTVAKNINPHYNANLHFPGVKYDVFMSSSIHVAILDEDLAGDHLLAEAKFPLNKVLPQMQKKFQISLEKPDLRETCDGLQLCSRDAGQIEVSLAHYVKSGTLKVLILKCHNLPPINEERSANPFVKAVLYPMNKQSRHQTTVKWKTTSPEFNEQFVYLTSVTELPKQNLHITVWDRGKDRPDKYIGGIILGMNAKGNRLQHWSDTIKTPGQTHSKIHYLSANYID